MDGTSFEDKKEDEGHVGDDFGAGNAERLNVRNEDANIETIHQRSSSSTFQAPPPLKREQRTTIDRPRAENIPQMPSPVSLSYPFHSLYDSDGSNDGSIVYNYQVPTPPQPTYEFSSRRDRFPSFDSQTSTGSFRVLPPPSATTYQHPSPNAFSSRSQMLPYDQRRKLAQKRQQQQQAQPSPVASPQLVPAPQPYPHQPYPQYPLPYQAPYAHSPSGQQYPMPPYGYPQLNQRQMQYIDPHFHQAPPYHYHAYNYSNTSNQNIPSPTPQLPPRRYRSNNKQQKVEKPSGSRRKAQQQLPYGYTQFQLPPSPPAPQPQQHSRPPSGMNRNYANSRSRSNLSAEDMQSPERSHRKAAVPPPPPPPPPPPSQSYHIRADSTGTVSSLGSSGGGQALSVLTDRLGNDIAGFIREESDSLISTIVQNLSPTTQRPVTVEEFHRRNQAFLQKTAKKKSSPKEQRSNSVSSRSSTRNTSTHRRLPSIEGDDWEEQEPRMGANESTVNTMFSSSDGLSEYSDIDERTSLLPPSGISTNEPEPLRGKNGKNRLALGQMAAHEPTLRIDNRMHTIASETIERERAKSERRKKKKKKSRSRRYRHREEESDNSSEFSESTDSSSFDYRQWTKKRARMLEKERAKLIAQWKAEALAEAEAARLEDEANKWHRRLGRDLEDRFTTYLTKAFRALDLLETFVSNLPQTIGAIALAIATLGVVWFKFAEENLDSCSPVHFHSSQCTFPEFPGCFYCDKSATMYRVAVNFHFGCSIVAGIVAMSFVLKVILAARVVIDEMSSPTTASPAGLICMTTVCVFAGRGLIGEVLVSAASSLHLCLAIWFIYMALAYHIMPDPSWWPNTCGIGLSAVKIWLYFPTFGHLLMAISLSLLFFFFPISLIRVTINRKISAPVGWIQMSAPAISLYALTIMAQPSFEEEHPDVTKFQRVHRMVYLPCMHFLFILSVIGLLSSAQSLIVRWGEFQKKEFSPAHAAFCFPTLAHANAIQAYRGAVNSFSDLKQGTPLKIALYTYWLVILISGTIATLYVTARFFYMLPAWTQIDVADEEEPPQPYETSLSRTDVITAGETLRQPFVSPAVLQANETGALVMLPRGPDGHHRFKRTRRLKALGFEPTMDWSEMTQEREILMEWVGRHPPRRRKRTLSVPGVDFNYGYGDFGFGNNGVYGAMGERDESRGHARGYSYNMDAQSFNTQAHRDDDAYWRSRF